MADYYPLLAKAVAALPESTETSRRAIYERARAALIGQLRKIEPPVGEADIERENAALDEAVARLEGDIAAKAAAAAPSPAPEQPALENPALENSATGAQAQDAGPAESVGENNSELEAPKPAERAQTPPRIAMPQRPAAPAGGPKPFSFRPPASTTPEIAADADAAGDAPVRPEPEDGDGIPEAKPLRPREAARPLAPTPARANPGAKRVWIIGGVVAAIVMAVIGTLAYLKRDQNPEGLARLGQGQPQRPAEQAANTKIAGRADGSAATPAPNPAPAPAPQQNPQTSPQPQQPAAAQPPLPVAYRAALLIDAPDTPEKVKTYIGSVVWRLDTVPTGTGRPVGTAIHADVDIPDAKVRMSLDMQKNLDDSLPASHTINVNFSLLPGSVIPGVKQIGVIQMRRDDSPNGEPLGGVPVQITDSAYLIGLARGDLVARNMDLLKNRGWVDLPLALSDGRIAKFSLEKGVAGDRVINDAIAAWDQEK
ncbi:MAG: hypothetical protein KGM42_04620 [Hyphomicrobiales bacterium]|nr:hypothetical protein [Hyphomicrobiales bacterium]